MNRFSFVAGALIAFTAQVALAGWVVFDRERALAEGTEIRLVVTPVDPRDLLRGEYVVLTYDISRLPRALFKGGETVERGDTVFVTLVPGEPGWTADAVHAQRPESAVAIRGTVRTTTPMVAGCTENCGSHIFVDYGIDRFFVPEGQGRALEQLRNDQRLSVDVAVGADGRATLKRLLVDGEVRSAVSLF